ncbi:6407_t:CDS:1, partial [Racocetra persica]
TSFFHCPIDIWLLVFSACHGKEMSDSNISKNDLLDICCSLGISTKGNKADLVQRLKEYQTNRSHENNVDGMKFTNDKADDESVISNYHTETTEILSPEIQMLRELLQKNKRPLHAVLLSLSPQDAEETTDHPQQTKRWLKNRNYKLERKIILTH